MFSVRSEAPQLDLWNRKVVGSEWSEHPHGPMDPWRSSGSPLAGPAPIEQHRGQTCTYSCFKRRLHTLAPFSPQRLPSRFTGPAHSCTHGRRTNTHSVVPHHHQTSPWLSACGPVVQPPGGRVAPAPRRPSMLCSRRSRDSITRTDANAFQKCRTRVNWWFSSPRGKFNPAFTLFSAGHILRKYLLFL